VFPFLFERTGSECITGLYDRMVTNRSRLARQHERTHAQRHGSVETSA